MASLQDLRQLHTAVSELSATRGFGAEAARPSPDERLRQLLDAASRLASIAADLPVSADGEIVPAVKDYLIALKDCRPARPQMTLVVDALQPVFERFTLQRHDPIHDRTLNLLAKSVAASALPVHDVSEFAGALGADIESVRGAARRAGLSGERLDALLRPVVRELIGEDLRQRCLDLSPVERRIEVCGRLCAAGDLVGALDAGAVAELTASVIAGLAQPSSVIGMDAAVAFGAELRRRALLFSGDAVGSLNAPVVDRVMQECRAWFRAAIAEALASTRDRHRALALVREAAAVFACAGMPAVQDDRDLRTAFWRDSVAVLARVAADRSQERAAGYAFEVAFDLDATGLVQRVFGASDDLCRAMLPVARALVESADSRAPAVLAAWLERAVSREAGAAAFDRADPEAFARRTVESLFEWVLSGTPEGDAVMSAARDLVAAREVAARDPAQGHLAPVTTVLASAWLRRAGAAELRSRIAGDHTGAPVPPELDIAALTPADGEHVLDLVCRDGRFYTHAERSSALRLVAAICGEGLAGWRPELAAVFIQYLEPGSLWYSSTNRSERSGDRKPLRHDAAFQGGRELLNQLMALDPRAAALDRVVTRIWELAQWLTAIRALAASSLDTAAGHERACRACLEEILTSEAVRQSISWSSGPTVDLEWRVARNVDAAVREVLFPALLDRAADGLASAPAGSSSASELEAVTDAVHQATAPEDRARCAARLVGCLPREEWARGRAACLLWIQLSLTRPGCETSVSAVQAALEAPPAIDRWTRDAALARLLCGLPDPHGARFMQMFLEHAGTGSLVTQRDHGTVLAALIGDMRQAHGAAALIAPLAAAARRALADGQVEALEGWGTLAAAVCGKARAWTAQAETSEIAAALAALDLRGFAHHVQLHPDRARVFHQPPHRAIREWQFTAQQLASDGHPAFAAIDVPALLAALERQFDFANVRTLLDAIQASRIARPCPDAILECVNVCIDCQDLDGVRLLLESGLCRGDEVADERAQRFLSGALNELWRRDECALAADALNELAVSGVVPAGTLSEAVAAAAEGLAAHFPGAPRLVRRQAGRYDLV